MKKLRVGIVGGSGYVGGELLRLLLSHPFVESLQVTSNTYPSKPVSRVHPHLRGKTGLRFLEVESLHHCDLLFLALPHGETMSQISFFMKHAEKIIDLSADFRLNNEASYKKWYGTDHLKPEMLEQFVYGIPELHRDRIRKSSHVSSAGCNATAVILALFPFFKNDLIEPDRTVIEAKVGSSEGGRKFSSTTHHPVRSGSVRSYKPTGHRHIAEMLQELMFGRDIEIHFSATSIEMVRGLLVTCHLFLHKNITEKEIWQMYRREYANEPFIRIVKENSGSYRYPEPKLLRGTNFCDIGFEKDENSNRVVVISAMDNMMKGAAGQAVQVFNIMYGFEETTGLNFPGLHPI